MLDTFFSKQEGKPLPVLKGLSTTPVDGDEPIAPPIQLPTPAPRATGTGGAR